MAASGGAVVLLGLEDAPLSAADEAASDLTVSRLGGRPDWPAPPPPPPPPACNRCGRPQPLVVQIYAPIGSSAYHRTLYVFGCVGPECANEAAAWRCLRGQQRAAEPAPAAPEPPALGATADWLDSADDWGDGEDGCGETISNSSSSNSGGGGDNNNAALTGRLAGLALDADNGNLAAAGASAGETSPASAELEPAGAGEDGVSPEPAPAPSCDLRALLTERPAAPPGQLVFQPVYLSVVEEPAPGKAASQHEMDLLRAYQAREGVNLAEISAPSGGGGGGDTAAERYESAAPAHGDRLLYKLIQRLQLCPGQVLRYGRDGGAPLPLCPLPAAPPRCRHCAGPAVFELQLLPTLVGRLRARDGAAERTGLLEFGTVIVFTCRDSCWTDGGGLREETVIVQAEVQ